MLEVIKRKRGSFIHRRLVGEMGDWSRPKIRRVGICRPRLHILARGRLLLSEAETRIGFVFVDGRQATAVVAFDFLRQERGFSLS
jgi:hypothetical protein